MSTKNLKKTKGHESRDQDGEQSDARLNCASLFVPFNYKWNLLYILYNVVILNNR